MNMEMIMRTSLVFCLVIVTTLKTCTCQTSPPFLIKHKLSGKVFHHQGGHSNPSNDVRIVLHSDIHDNTHFRFEKKENHWGYIVHVKSGKIIHPRGGSMNPRTGVQLVLHSDRHAAAHFGLDQANDVIVHRGGKFAHPEAGLVAVPPNDNPVGLYPDMHDGMRFVFVSPTNLNEEVTIYGKPKLLGEWKIIHMVINPIAEHTDTLQIKVGKSKTESTEFTFKYKWEATGGMNAGIFSGSVTSSLEFMLKQTSSVTWTEEIIRTRGIKVLPGQTVVTWQFVYEVTQDDHKGVYRSNILADTNSETPPRNFTTGTQPLIVL